MSKYNATVYHKMSNGGRGTFAAHAIELNGSLQMTRANFVQCTGYEDRIGVLKDTGEEVALYDMYIGMRYPDSEFEIVVDNCEGYRNALSGLGLPPAYKR